MFEDDASVCVGPVPCMNHEFFTGEVGFVDALLAQLAHHLCFGGDRGVVGTGDPAGIFALHTGATDQYILYGVVEHGCVNAPYYVAQAVYDNINLGDPIICHN